MTVVDQSVDVARLKLGIGFLVSSECTTSQRITSRGIQRTWGCLFIPERSKYNHMHSPKYTNPSPTHTRTRTHTDTHTLRASEKMYRVVHALYGTFLPTNTTHTHTHTHTHTSLGGPSTAQILTSITYK